MAQVSLVKLEDAAASVEKVNAGVNDCGQAFYQSKVHTARYYFSRLLPRRLSLIASIKAGSDCLFTIDDDLF
jgi:hypothetical protein